MKLTDDDQEKRETIEITIDDQDQLMKEMKSWYEEGNWIKNIHLIDSQAGWAYFDALLIFEVEERM